MRSTGFAALVAIALAVLTPAAEGLQDVAREQPPATFRSATDIVQVDAVVQDKTGAIVADLSPADFEVLEDGRPQSIEQFYFVRGGVRTRTVAAPVTGTAEVDAKAASAAPAARVFVTFFDEDHLSPAGFKRVQNAALALFDKHFAPTDLGGVVENGRMANNRLTSSRDELVAAVRRAKPNGKPASRRMDESMWPRLTTAEAIRIVVNGDATVLAQAIQRACADDPTLCQNAELAVRGKAAQLANDARADTAQTGQQLIALLNGLARFEGRKTVLLFSEGFFADESWPLIKDALAQAARANARIYTFDARGLDRGGMSDRLAGIDPGGSDSLARLLAQTDTAGDAVNSLAVDSGGFVIRNTNMFDRAVAQVADDAGTYYVLGYRSTRPPDGSFRRLSVKVKRAGLIVRARRGYAATVRPLPTVTEAAEHVSAHDAPTSAETAAGAASAATATPAEPLRSAPSAEASAPAAIAPQPAAPAESAVERTIRVRPNVEEHVRTLGPTTRDADADAGWEAYKRGDVESAQRLLSAAAGRPSAAPWVHYALGQSAYALRAYQDAVTAWERVRSSTPEFEPVYFDLVDGYLQLKEYDRATRALRDAEKRWPTDPEIANALGVVQVARGALDDALASFERAVATAPNDAVGYFNVGKTAELRYWKTRRYNNRTGQWFANENDRRKAIDSYTRYLQIGGPLENAARDALSRLNWSSR